LIDKFKGEYRILCDYDLATKDFNRKLNGNYEDIDCYIDCKNGRIFHYGNSILQCYIPSIQTGRSIIKTIYFKYINPNNAKTEVSEYDIERNGECIHISKENILILDVEIFNNDLKNKSNIIFDIEETDSEVLFKFKYVNSNKIIPLMKPKTSGAGISPFSIKNLPKSDFKIPDSDLDIYKQIISNIPRTDFLSIKNITNDYLKTLCSKRNAFDKIKADMRLKGLKAKEYIYVIGKWEEYIKYLNRHLKM
jgi:hypothetical protein